VVAREGRPSFESGRKFFLQKRLLHGQKRGFRGEASHFLEPPKKKNLPTDRGGKFSKARQKGGTLSCRGNQGKGVKKRFYMNRLSARSLCVHRKLNSMV